MFPFTWMEEKSIGNQCYLTFAENILRWLVNSGSGLTPIHQWCAVKTRFYDRKHWFIIWSGKLSESQSTKNPEL